jgi:hypothetical protein
LAVAVESVMRKVQRALRSGLIEADTPEEQIAQAVARAIIDEDEAAGLRAADAARFDAITVDEFPPEAFGHSDASGACRQPAKGEMPA